MALGTAELHEDVHRTATVKERTSLPASSTGVVNDELVTGKRRSPVECAVRRSGIVRVEPCSRNRSEKRDNRPKS
jgi:hypothetical protein